MDAIKYFETKKRLTKGCYISCSDCPFAQHNNGMGEDCCGDFEMKYPEMAVEIVEKWAEEHPIKTRQSEFMKLFPDVIIDTYGTIAICPCSVEKSFKAKCGDQLCTEFVKIFGLRRLAMNKNTAIAKIKNYMIGEGRI